jgi:hypothetical protein
MMGGREGGVERDDNKGGGGGRGEEHTSLAVLNEQQAEQQRGCVVFLLGKVKIGADGWPFVVLGMWWGRGGTPAAALHPLTTLSTRIGTK